MKFLNKQIKNQAKRFALFKLLASALVVIGVLVLFYSLFLSEGQDNTNLDVKASSSYAVLAINVSKSSYFVGEDVKFDMSVLNRRGNMVCNADIKLEVKEPDGNLITISTSDGGIKSTSSCKVKNGATEPDYTAIYTPEKEGQYRVSVMASYKDVKLEKTLDFLVDNNPEFVISRDFPTRIYPPTQYKAKFNIWTKNDFSGVVTELIPANFEVTKSDDFFVKKIKNNYQLNWNISLAAGVSKEFSYSFKSPNNYPDYKELGPIAVVAKGKGLFKETRSWQLAIDSIGQIGMWRHTSGASPTTSWAKVVWDAQDRNDGGIYVRNGTNDDITLPSGRFLLMYQVAWYASGQNGRGNVEVGCFKDSSLVEGSLGSGYQRNTANDAAWAKGQCIVDSNGSNVISIQHRRDTDAYVGSFDSNRTWLNIVEIPSNTDYGYYTDGTDTSSDGGTAWNDVPFDSATESGSSISQQTSTTIDLAANSEYLLLYSVAYDNSSTSRTARFTQLISGSSHIPGSYGYGYMRTSSDQYGDPNSMLLYRTGGSTETIKLQARRSLLGSPVDGTVTRRINASGLWIIKLPSYVESFISYDSTGGQDATLSAFNANIFETEVSGNDSAFLSKSSNSALSASEASDALLMSSVYIARASSNGTRLTREAVWKVNGSNQAQGAHGSYNRGAYGGKDVYDSVLNPIGLFSLGSSDSINLEIGETLDSGWDDGGGSPTTQGGYVGFSALNLDSLSVPLPGAPVLYPDDAGSNQIAFNNSMQNDTTPIVRVSATNRVDFSYFQVEFNTASDFSGTAYTQTFNGTYSSGVKYNLQTTSSLGLPSTNGVTYYVRARASTDGSSYGNWSANTWTYTYTNSAGEVSWYQTTDEQFDTGTLSSTQTNGSDSVELTSGSGSQVFSSAASTTWTVPSGVTEITVKAWGAGGGGGGAGSSGNGGSGGGGGYAQSTLSVTPGETLNIYVGGGGGGGTVYGTTTAAGAGGGGGGRSEIERGTTPLVVAGAGAGGGGGDNSSATAGGNGGAGGGNVGATGGSSSSAGGGAGGDTSSSTGGTGGSGGENAGVNGALESGGDGGNGGASGSGSGGESNGGSSNGGNGGIGDSAAYGGGGGGGAGHYGGGGGSSSLASDAGAGGGGGGSNYLTGTAQTNSQASGSTPPNTSDSDYAGSAGQGGTGGTTCTDGTCSGNSGSDGRIVINYSGGTGTIMSPEIDFDWNINETSWGEASFGTTETSGDVKLRIYYTSTSACDTIVPDSALSGNSSGFDVSSSPIDISGLSTTTYNKICLQATLIDSGGSPTLDEWSVSWGGSPVTKQLHYRWRDDSTDLNTSGGWLASEDSNLSTNINRATTYRLRVEVANTGVEAQAAAKTYELQFGDMSAEGVSSCSAVSSWTGIADATDDFTMSGTSYIDPDGESTTSGLLANSEGYTRGNGVGLDIADTSSSIGPISALSYTELEYSVKATDDAITGHTYCFRLFDTTGSAVLDDYTVYPQLRLDYTTVPNSILEWGSVANVSDSAWTTVSFNGTYANPVFVCTPHYYNNIGNEPDGDADAVVCRVNNLDSTHAQIRLQQPGGASLGAAETVYWVVAETGVYDYPDVKFEAFTYLSTNTYSKAAGYAGDAQSYSQSYTNPIVMGQVQTYNDTNWSVFFSHGAATNSPPDSTNLYTGKHIGEDTTTARNNETLGVIIFEQKHGTLDGTEFEAAMGGQTIDRIDDAPPQTYSFLAPFATTPSIAATSVAGVNGQDGPKSALYGANPLSTTNVNLTIMEDEIGDTEQTGVMEYVPYVVFANSGHYTPKSLSLDQTTFRFFNNADSVQPGSGIDAENTLITGVANSDILRLRIALQAGMTNEIASHRSYKLQYGTGQDCSSVGSWTDVDALSGTAAWRGYNNATPADGTTISSSLLNSSLNSLESYEEENSSVKNPNQIFDGARGEWDWVLQQNNASSSTYYCFRMVTDRGGALHYSRYAQVKTDGVAPTVSNVTVNGGLDISLTEATTSSVSWTATVTDLDGYNDITSVTGRLYRSGVAGAQTCTLDDNNCYQDASCTLSSCSGNSCTATCTVGMQFFAEPTDSGSTYASEYWRGWVKATDSDSKTGEDFSAANTPDVNTLRALNTDASIGYGSLLAGDDTGAVNQTTTVTNTGNVSIDVLISGTDMCTDYPTCSANSFAVTYQEYSTASFSYGSGTSLTSSSVTVDLSIAKPTVSPSNSSSQLYWGIEIPSIQPVGVYSGEVTISATDDT